MPDTVHTVREEDTATITAHPWERWPWYIYYGPLVFFWIWNCLRTRSLWFFTASNPTITFGGLEGEGKREIYAQMPPESYPKTIYIQPGIPEHNLLEQVKTAQFDYPIIVKPHIGMAAVLFRRIDTEAELLRYHQQVPVEYLVQDWVDYPVEVSVFYCRLPGESKGEITGITQRNALKITGDGRSTFWELIVAQPLALPHHESIRLKFSDRLQERIPAGAEVSIFHAGNRNQGASLVNLTDRVDEQLTAVFDELSAYSKHFYYGRYDIKCASFEDLRQGKNYSILEYNGCGAGPNHVYHRGLTIWQAWAETLRHWRFLFEISVENHRRGAAYWPFLKGARFILQSRRDYERLKQLDKKMS